jgi:hypothetical protein
VYSFFSLLELEYSVLFVFFSDFMQKSKRIKIKINPFPSCYSCYLFNDEKYPAITIFTKIIKPTDVMLNDITSEFGVKSCFVTDVCTYWARIKNTTFNNKAVKRNTFLVAQEKHKLTCLRFCSKSKTKNSDRLIDVTTSCILFSRHATNMVVRKRVHIHASLKFLIITAQCFGFFPVQGVSSHNLKFLKFSWMSVRVIFSLFICILGWFDACANIRFMILEGFHPDYLSKHTTLSFVF